MDIYPAQNDSLDFGFWLDGPVRLRRGEASCGGGVVVWRCSALVRNRVSIDREDDEQTSDTKDQMKAKC